MRLTSRSGDDRGTLEYAILGMRQDTIYLWLQRITDRWAGAAWSPTT